jgi:mannose-1-phosphate guanylyltransferase
MNTYEHYYAVIMAGGGGTRLWPLSRRTSPKQMLRLTGERTMFQIAVDRLAGLFTPERIMVVTVAEQAQALQNQCPEIPMENYLLEPMPRGTASVVGLAAMALQARDPDAVMAVLTADHFIQNVEGFHQVLTSAEQVAQEGYLVTLGITPTFPATGYGYIQQGQKIGSYGGLTAYLAQRFVEKPDETNALRLLESGDHHWNSGMFIWRVDRIMEEFERLMPALYQQLLEILAVWKETSRSEVLNTVWPQIKPQTIDYGIMEHARRVAVLPARELGWNDVGSWESLYDVLQADADGNILVNAQHLSLDTHESLVCTDNPKRLIVTIGVKDLVVVDTGDALLICNRHDAQRVREVVSQLKQTNRTEYL